MAKYRKFEIDLDFLKSMYKIDPETLDEMALPSFFHSNPLIRWITRTRIKKALSLINLKEDIRLVDFGCGPGVLLLQIPVGMGDLFGVDIELWPAKMMISHYKREDIQLLDARVWIEAVPDQSLDYIVATEVLEHIEDTQSVITSFKEKLVSGGKLIVSLPTENALYKLGRKIAGFSGEYHQDKIVDIEEACNKEGLALEKKFSLPLPGFSLYKFYRFSK